MKDVCLAIVIPYYKKHFFRELLNALVSQTDQSFNVYIGDDCAPSDAKDLIEELGDQLCVIYHRFETRMGDISLAGHWNRCLKLLNNESWVWVLPDDDLPASNCVAEFLEEVRSGRSDGINVFRFPVKTVDAMGQIVTDGSSFHDAITNYEFYLKQLKGEIGPFTLGENIFRREALIRSGGFVEFPKAWGSDHATVIRVSAAARIANLSRAWFGFRQSDVNISSRRDDGALKMHARVCFAQWLKHNDTLFSKPPSPEFYRLFYWRGEYFAVHVWQFTPLLFWHLLRLRWLCLRSLNVLALGWLFLKRHHSDSPDE